MKQRSFHHIIFKNTGLFGFSQIIKIAVKLVTNKMAALFLGPFGIGLIGLIENILQLIQGFTNFGIAQSSVREIALVTDETSDENLQEQRLLQIIYKWALATGILGFVVCLIFSTKISEVIFETSSDYKWIFILSFYFILNSVSTIRMAVLQAKKQVTAIVKYNILLAILTSIIASIGYYYFGLASIIPVILSTSLTGFLLSLYFTRNIKVLSTSISLKQVFNEGLPMAKLGLLLSVSVIFGQICFYSIRWFLKENYSYETLGIYQVSNTILVGYLGLVFTAMANDFYPRLCNYENDTKNFNNLINDQTEFALLFVVPAVIGLYLIAPYLIIFLYSKEFLDVVLILKIGLFAIILKALIWPIGFITLVKGNKLLYLKQNLLGDGVNLIASIVMFYYFGYMGLGLAMVVMFLLAGIYNYYIAVKLYQFSFRKETKNIIFISIVFGISAILLNYFSNFSTFNYYIIPLLFISIGYSFINLKKRLKL